MCRLLHTSRTHIAVHGNKPARAWPPGCIGCSCHQKGYIHCKRQPSVEHAACPYTYIASLPDMFHVPFVFSTLYIALVICTEQKAKLKHTNYAYPRYHNVISQNRSMCGYMGKKRTPWSSCMYNRCNPASDIAAEYNSQQKQAGDTCCANGCCSQHAACSMRTSLPDPKRPQHAEHSLFLKSCVCSANATRQDG